MSSILMDLTPWFRTLSAARTLVETGLPVRAKVLHSSAMLRAALTDSGREIAIFIAWAHSRGDQQRRQEIAPSQAIKSTARGKKKAPAVLGAANPPRDKGASDRGH